MQHASKKKPKAKTTTQRGMQVSTSYALQLTEKCHTQKVCWRTELMLSSTAEREPYELLTVTPFTIHRYPHISEQSPVPSLGAPANPVWAKKLTWLPCLVVYVKFQFQKNVCCAHFPKKYQEYNPNFLKNPTGLSSFTYINILPAAIYVWKSSTVQLLRLNLHGYTATVHYPVH